MRFRPTPPAVLLAWLAWAPPLGAAEDVPTEASPELRAAQQAADAAYEAGRYLQAYEIYLGDLAPAGDKYAQYMIGIMHAHGLGVQQDPALGAAWLALAAERGDERLEAASDEALAGLPEEQRPRRDTLLTELRASYGDCALVGRLLAGDRRRVTASTGSRVKSNVNAPLTIIHMQDEDDRSIDQQSLRERIRKRERFLRERCS